MNIKFIHLEGQIERFERDKIAHEKEQDLLVNEFAQMLRKGRLISHREGEEYEVQLESSPERTTHHAIAHVPQEDDLREEVIDTLDFDLNDFFEFDDQIH